MRSLDVGIVGATGAVGVEFLELLARRDFPVGRLRLFGSARSAGTRVPWRGRAVEVEDLAHARVEGLDLALFSAGKAVSKAHAARFAAAGAYVVDNSSAFRGDPDVPLIVPEVNAAALADGQPCARSRVIANPNCSTIILLVPLAPIHRAIGVEQCVVSTYQAVSGAGKVALDELLGQARAFAAGEPERCAVWDRPIFLNVIPRIGGLLDDGDTEEEAKFTAESRKILGDWGFQAYATTVRVPVERCHSESVFLRLARPTSSDEIRRIWDGAPGVAWDDLATPREWARREEVAVSRLRVDADDPHVVRFWCVSDQLWKGAALNAIQIAEELIRLGRFAS